MGTLNWKAAPPPAPPAPPPAPPPPAAPVPAPVPVPVPPPPVPPPPPRKVKVMVPQCPPGTVPNFLDTEAGQRPAAVCMTNPGNQFAGWATFIEIEV